MTLPRLVMFDLDGTLVDSAPQIAGLLNGMRAEAGLGPLPTSDYRAWVSLGAGVLVENALPVTAETKPLQVEEFRRRYRGEPTPGDALFPAVAQSLAALGDAGVALAICSNKPEGLCRKVLADCGLTGHFPLIIGGDTLARSKPDPLMLRHVMEATGHAAADALFIGDSVTDQRTAVAAGVRFGLFEPGYDDGVDPALVWHSIPHYEDFVARLHRHW